MCLISVVRLAGPSPSFSHSSPGRSFRSILSKARRRVNTHIFARVRRIMSANATFSLPGWASALYSYSSLSGALPVATVWSRVLRASEEFHHRLSAAPRVSSDFSSSVYGELSAYAQSIVAKREDITPLDAALVDLPPVGHRPVPLMQLLQWPWTEIFSEAGFKDLLIQFGRDLASYVKSYSSFKTDKDYVLILSALAMRTMVRFVGPDDA